MVFSSRGADMWMVLIYGGLKGTRMFDLQLRKKPQTKLIINLRKTKKSDFFLESSDFFFLPASAAACIPIWALRSTQMVSAAHS